MLLQSAPCAGCATAGAEQRDVWASMKPENVTKYLKVNPRLQGGMWVVEEIVCLKCNEKIVDTKQIKWGGVDMMNLFVVHFELQHDISPLFTVGSVPEWGDDGHKEDRR